MTVFDSNNYIHNLFDHTWDSIINNIENKERDYLLNVNEEEYIDYLYTNHEIEKLSVNFDKTTAEESEKYVSGLNFFRETIKVKKTMIIFKIPIISGSNLLNYYPSSFTSCYGVFKEKNLISTNEEIRFEIVVYDDNNLESVNREYDHIINILKSNIDSINNDVIKFNNNIKITIKNHFKTHKEDLIKKQNSLKTLKVPLKRNSNFSDTFSIPISKPKRKISILPKVNNTNNQIVLEPTLDLKVYKEILKIINDCGKEFERISKTYTGFKEEDLRNSILMLINSHYEGTGTGETFNNKGKTDILLRHDNNIAFIAECKIWSGISNFKNAIDQLLKYLTWRDTKTALIIFIRKGDISNIISTVKSEINSHSKFKNYINSDDNSWLNYEFFINDDLTINANVAIMFYYLPI